MTTTYGAGLILLAVLLSIVASIDLGYGVYAQQAQTGYEGGRLEPYSIYRTAYVNLSISAIMTSIAPGMGVVGIAGQSTLGSYIFEAIHIDRSLQILKRSAYMIGSKPTAIFSDGDYGSYIAVGNERGEVLLYNILDRRVSYIQVSRYPVKSLAIGVAVGESSFLSVLDSGGYLYMYRATRGGGGLR